MTTTNAIIEVLKKEDKFSLHYVLKAIDHKNWFYTYQESYKKKELLDAAIKIAKNNPEKFKQLSPYKNFF
jgi:hypothetical protein